MMNTKISEVKLHGFTSLISLNILPLMSGSLLIRKQLTFKKFLTDIFKALD